MNRKKIYWQWNSRGVLATAATAFAFVLNACTPSMFSSDIEKRPDSVTSYRKIGAGCSDLNLTSSAIDPQTLLGLQP